LIQWLSTEILILPLNRPKIQYFLTICRSYEVRVLIGSAFLLFTVWGHPDGVSMLVVIVMFLGNRYFYG